MFVFHKVVSEAFKHFQQDDHSFGIVALGNRLTIRCAYLFVVLAHEAILGYSNTAIRTLVFMKIPSLGDEDVFVGQ